MMAGMSKGQRDFHRMFTEHLEKVGQEKTEFQDPETDCDGLILEHKSRVTKAEALARHIWKLALGYTERVGKEEEKEVEHKPDKWAIALLFNRIEGKVKTTENDATGKTTLADRVSEQRKKQLNALANESTD